MKAAGFTDVVLLGMGGSSLWPEVLSVRAGRAAGGPALHVLDNTDPAAVAAVDGLIAGKKTLFVVASKSGGTIEIQAFERHFWQKTLARSGGDVARAGANFVAITDPATRLGQLAEEKHYRRVFINPADIGGRYSALSYFGLVPAALRRRRRRRAARRGRSTSPPPRAPAVPVAESPGVVLGAALGAARAAGRDKLTLVHLAGHRQLRLVDRAAGRRVDRQGRQGDRPRSISSRSARPRATATIASSSTSGRRRPTRKQDAAVTALERAGQPVVRIAVDRHEALGREIFRWEMATAIAVRDAWA